MSTKPAPCLAGLTLLAGCAGTTPFTGSGMNSLIDIQYGTIEQVQEVKLKANYGSGVLLGGGIGALAAMHYSGTTEALAAEQQAAVDCAAAKQDMLKATTEQAAKIAYEKMKALCSS
jgi:outer membrane lipoprotein SlyB